MIMKITSSLLFANIMLRRGANLIKINIILTMKLSNLLIIDLRHKHVHF